MVVSWVWLKLCRQNQSIRRMPINDLYINFSKLFPFCCSMQLMTQTSVGIFFQSCWVWCSKQMPGINSYWKKKNKSLIFCFFSNLLWIFYDALSMDFKGQHPVFYHLTQEKKNWKSLEGIPESLKLIWTLLLKIKDLFLWKRQVCLQGSHHIFVLFLCCCPFLLFRVSLLHNNWILIFVLFFLSLSFSFSSSSLFLSLSLFVLLQ